METKKPDKTKTNEMNSNEMKNQKFPYKFLLPSDNFSPESGGSANPSSAIDAIKTQGTIKLKK